jgi:hypothetical protein
MDAKTLFISSSLYFFHLLFCFLNSLLVVASCICFYYFKYISVGAPAPPASSKKKCGKAIAILSELKKKDSVQP